MRGKDGRIYLWACQCGLTLCPEPGMVYDCCLHTCRYCGEDLHQVEGVWVDDTDGDCCSGDDNLVNENGVHQPFV